MKKIPLFIALIFSGTLAFSQTNETLLAQKATQEFVSDYQLTPAQTTEMQKIQERKYRNLSEIKDLKKSNIALYNQKMNSLEYGTDMSVTRLLKSNKTQLAAFNKMRGERRLAKAKFMQQMKNQGLAKEEIEAKYWEEQFKEKN